MKRKLFLLVQVFLASMMTVVNAQTFDAEKTYTIECYNQGGKYMQDNGDGYIVPKAFNDNSYWYLVATGNEGCYYVKNATTNRYMQKTSEYQVSVKTGDDPVEILIKNDPAKGTNVYALTDVIMEARNTCTSKNSFLFIELCFVLLVMMLHFCCKVMKF